MLKIFWFKKRKSQIFFREYYFLLSAAKYKPKYGKRMKKLTTKQMLQILLSKNK